jgi:hypothetical protein
MKEEEFTGKMIRIHRSPSKKKIFILLFLLIALSWLAVAEEGRGDHCYSILVGKKANVDGSVIVGHNEDDSGNIIVNLRKNPSS